MTSISPLEMKLKIRNQTKKLLAINEVSILRQVDKLLSFLLEWF